MSKKHPKVVDESTTPDAPAGMHFQEKGADDPAWEEKARQERREALPEGADAERTVPSEDERKETKALDQKANHTPAVEKQAKHRCASCGSTDIIDNDPNAKPTWAPPEQTKHAGRPDGGSFAVPSMDDNSQEAFARQEALIRRDQLRAAQRDAESEEAARRAGTHPSAKQG